MNKYVPGANGSILRLPSFQRAARRQSTSREASRRICVRRLSWSPSRAAFHTRWIWRAWCVIAPYHQQAHVSFKGVCNDMLLTKRPIDPYPGKTRFLCISPLVNFPRNSPRSLSLAAATEQGVEAGEGVEVAEVEGRMWRPIMSGQANILTGEVQDALHVILAWSWLCFSLCSRPELQGHPCACQLRAGWLTIHRSFVLRLRFFLLHLFMDGLELPFQGFCPIYGMSYYEKEKSSRIYSEIHSCAFSDIVLHTYHYTRHPVNDIQSVCISILYTVCISA